MNLPDMIVSEMLAQYRPSCVCVCVYDIVYEVNTVYSDVKHP